MNFYLHPTCTPQCTPLPLRRRKIICCNTIIYISYSPKGGFLVCTPSGPVRPYLHPTK